MFTIGEFSKITDLSIKALRIYHEKELLIPSIVDDTSNYRYYKEVDIEKAKTIKFLKDLTFSLSEVKEILESFGDEADLARVLENKRGVIEAKINSLQLASKSIDQIIAKEKDALTMSQNNEFEVEEKDIDSYLIASLRWKGKYSETGKAFGKLMRAFGMNVCGKPFNLYYDEDYKDEGADIQSCVPVKKGKSKGDIVVFQIDAAKCVSLIHKGAYDQIGRSYAKLFKYLHAKNHKPILPYREIYLKGPGMILKGNPANYLTEIQAVLGI